MRLGLAKAGGCEICCRTRLPACLLKYPVTNAVMMGSPEVKKDV